MNLGERTVNGHYDHDRIEVGRYDGKFSKLTVVVENSELEMVEMKIRFADGSEYKPAVTGFYREDQRTRVIEMPPGESIIRNIDFKYRQPGGGHARVQVWGFKTGNAVPPPVRRYTWDTTGWVLLGEKTVDYTYNGTADHDRIDVGAYEGRFSKLQMVVDDADMDLHELLASSSARPHRVQAERCATSSPRVQSATREIQLPPGGSSGSRMIDLRYSEPASAGRARSQSTCGASRSRRPSRSSRGTRTAG